MFKKGQITYERQGEGKPKSNLKAREMFKIIGGTVDLPYEKVQDVFQAWYEMVEYCLEKNISITLPNVGEFKTSEFIAKKRGDTTFIPKGFPYKDENGERTIAQERIEVTIDEDRLDYYVPKFKFYKAFKNKIKEGTYHNG